MSNTKRAKDTKPGTMNAATTGLVWTRTDRAGRTVPGGVYAYRLTIGRAVTSGKLVVSG
jgi:hypothetical protein